MYLMIDCVSYKFIENTKVLIGNDTLYFNKVTNEQHLYEEKGEYQCQRPHFKDLFLPFLW